MYTGEALQCEVATLERHLAFSRRGVEESRQRASEGQDDEHVQESTLGGVSVTEINKCLARMSEEATYCCITAPSQYL